MKVTPKSYPKNPTFQNVNVPGWDQEQIFYVGKHGSDSNDGKTGNNAFLTHGAAIASAVAQTPASDNRFNIICIDAGVYTENLTIPAWVGVISFAANIVGTHTLEDNSLLEAFRFSASTGVVFVKTTGTGVATVRCARLQLSGSAVGLVCTSGEINYTGNYIEVENGIAIGDGSTGIVHVDVSDINIVGTGYGVGLVSTGTLNIKATSIQKSGSGTGTAMFSSSTGTINANLSSISTTAAWSIASGGTLNLICGDLSGTQAGAGTINHVSASNGAKITGDVHVNGCSYANNFRMPETTTPTPVPDYGVVYFKSDNMLYFQDGAGTERVIGLGSSDYGEMGNVFGSDAPEIIPSADEWCALHHANITGSAPHLNSGFTFVAGFDGSGTTTTAQAGASINIADTAHGLADGDIVTIQSANHVGVGTVLTTGVTDNANNFEVDISYVADEAITWQMGSYLLVATSGTYRGAWNASFYQSTNNTKTTIVTPFISTTSNTKATAQRLLTNNTDIGSIGGNTLAEVTAGDRIWFAVKTTVAQTLTFTIRNASIH